MSGDNQMEQMALRDSQQTTSGTGLTSNALKAVAIFAMLLDHTAYFFLPPGSLLYMVFRTAGRITGPVMFYLLVVGYRHTRSVNRYMLRLGIFAIISYLPYYYMINKALPSGEHFANFSVLYTLFLGLLALRVRHEIKNSVIQWLIIGGILALSVIGDWNYLAIVYILIFDYFYGDFNKQAFAYSMATLFRLLPTLIIPVRAFFTGTEPAMDSFMLNLYQLGAFLPIILLRFYNGKRGKGGFWSKWGFYIFYPLHLAVLGLIYYFLV